MADSGWVLISTTASSTGCSVLGSLWTPRTNATDQDPPAYRLINNQMFLRGQLWPGTAGVPALTFAAGYRPWQRHWLSQHHPTGIHAPSRAAGPVAYVDTDGTLVAMDVHVLTLSGESYFVDT
ncbi:MAG TPA: hypothetical protein VMU75_01655 [Acidimicrobiales bacterium]|nr:hypothetical protein [Acidimicrobiales bacterium]